jgi:cobalamin biosynthesis Mg chelatase CobN
MNATVTLYTSFIIDVPQLVIYVGHSNNKIDEIQGTGITFQYLEKLNMYEGEIRDISAYISGNGTVTVDVWADEKNISALKLYDGTTETHSPISFTSTNTSERTIVVTVKALSEGTTGVLHYRVSSNNVTKLYTTQITIGPPVSRNKEISTNPSSIMQIIVIIVILLVVIYMVFLYVKNRMR